jgi:hypothetical protein
VAGLLLAACGLGLVGSGGADPAAAASSNDAAVGDASALDATVDTVVDGSTGDGAALPNEYESAVLSRKPLVYYRFEEASGAAAGDSSGNGKAGTYANVRHGDASARARLGLAAGFDKATIGSVSVPSLGSLTTLTIEVWLRPKTIVPSGDWNTIFNVDTFPTGALHFQLETYGSGDIEFTVNNGGGNNDTFGGGTLPLGAWSYVVATYDRSKADVRFYVNGVAAGTGTFSSPTAAVVLGAGHIGAWNGTSRPFDGSLDELAIYGEVLTPAEIAAHYAAAGP